MSKELQSARQLVSNTLTFLGYEPEWQDIFGTEAGDLREMLRRRIDACKAVVQVVGQCYGAEPPIPDDQFGRVSYTQYEALYARHKKKKVWYLILNDEFTTDAYTPESKELRDLQLAYRACLMSGNVVHHSLANRDALEANVLKLRNELAGLRRGVKQWAVVVASLLALSVGLGVSVLHGQRGFDAKLDRVLSQTTLKFSEERSKIRREHRDQTDAEIDQRTYEALARQLGVDARVLKEKLPQFADQLRKDPNASAYKRASAAYVAKDYNEAERLALVAADEAMKASKASDVIKAFELAGNSAIALIEYARAMQHLRAAAQLTDRTRDSLEWARQQRTIAIVLENQGKYAEAETIYRNALSEYQRARGEEDADVLTLRNDLSCALLSQGNYAEAETQNREVIRLQEKVHGPEAPATLGSRNNLALALYSQGKYAEAEEQHREVMNLREKVLGPEHPDTLDSRNNLALTLGRQHKNAEAEVQQREVVKRRQKVLGPDHPDTLASRSNLASMLVALEKYAEAETQFREVIKLQEKVLGPEHPSTLNSRHNLANALRAQGQSAEAEALYRDVIKLEEKVLGPEHPETLRSRSNLATLLDDDPGKRVEAETQYRDVLRLREKVLGPNHPYTLDYQKLWKKLQKN